MAGMDRLVAAAAFLGTVLDVGGIAWGCCHDCLLSGGQTRKSPAGCRNLAHGAKQKKGRPGGRPLLISRRFGNLTQVRWTWEASEKRDVGSCATDRAGVASTSW